MEIDALRIVALVAQQGSFAAAARVFSLDPSSVSRTVASVEASLGLRLFHRTTRTLRLTEEGAIYLARVVPLLEELDQARDLAGQLRTSPSGTLRMTASVAFTHECIVPHLGGFHARYPEIAVELIPTDAVLDIAANNIDLAVRLGPAPSGDLVSTRLHDTRYLVCASPRYLEQHGAFEDPRDLANRPCLRFALPEFRTRWQFRRGEAAPIEVPIDGWLIIGNALSLRRAAIDGLGPVLLADWLVNRDIAEGRLIDLFPDYSCTATTFETAAWALYPSRSYLPRKVRVMIDFLRGRLSATRS